MAKSSARDSIKLTSVDELFSTEESRADSQREKVLDIPLSEISDFHNHPFKVKADEAMLEMADSVKQYGVLVPGLVRPKADGGYEMVAGHRRKKASELAGKETMPCIVRDLDNDAATIIMVDSNLQRESVVVKGIIIHNKRVLIVRRSADDETGANTWECVGGQIDFGEDLEEALIREIKEEVDLPIVVDKLLYAVTFRTDENRQVIILTYSCTTHHNVVTLSNEHSNYLWATKEQMMSLLSKPIVDDLNRNSVWEDIAIE